MNHSLFSQTRLDSLVLESNTIRSQGVRGFIIKNTAHLDSFSEVSRIIQDFPRNAVVSKFVYYDTYVQDLQKLDTKINDLELKLAKATDILSNLTESSKSHQDTLSIITKLIEALTGLLVAAGAVYGALKYKRFKKE